MLRKISCLAMQGQMRCNLGAGRDGLRWTWALQQSNRSQDCCQWWKIEEMQRQTVTFIPQLKSMSAVPASHACRWACSCVPSWPHIKCHTQVRMLW